MVLRDLAPDVFRFGHFTLEPQRRLLSIDGNPIPLSSRAFDILLFLVEQRDRIVTKDEIFARVWPGTIVEENNLAVQISALRRALSEPPGDPKLVMTVPGRGYRFVGTIEDAARDADETAPVPPQPPHSPEVATTRPRTSRPIGWAVGVAILVIVLASIGARTAFRGAPVAPRLSIAVLPFRNLSDDTRQDSLALAISQDLATDLARIPGSTVKPRKAGAEVEEIGRSANVRYVLEGSLTIQGDAFNVNAELFDTDSGKHLCCDRFNVTRDTLGADREQIVRRIASMLNDRLIQIEAARSLHERAAHPDAFDDYLRARSTLDHGTAMASLREAQNLLERAAKSVSNFNDAQSELETAIEAELGMILLKKMSDFGDNDNFQADHAEARAAIADALAKNAHAPVAITANGMLAMIDDRCDEALPRFASAKELDPNEVRAMEGFALCSRQMGHMADMIAELKKILTIDPASPENAHREQLIGSGYLLLGDPASAKAWLARAAADLPEDEDATTPSLDPKEWRHLYLIAAAELIGEHSVATKMYDSYKRRFPNRSVWRIASYFTKALYHQAGSQKFLAALESAGMPRYLSDETKDFGVSEKSPSQADDDFDPTPTSLTGAKTIVTQTVYTLLHVQAKPILVDVARGAGVMHDACWIWTQGWWVDRDAAALGCVSRHGATPDTPIVVMGDNLLGWDSYRAGQFLVAHGYRNVLWYRGGEEAWASHGYDAEDKRPL